MVIIKVYYTNHKEYNYTMGVEMYNRQYISTEKVHEMWMEYINKGLYVDYYVYLETVA